MSIVPCLFKYSSKLRRWIFGCYCPALGHRVRRCPTKEDILFYRGRIK